MQVGSIKIGDFRQITRYNSKTSTVASAVNLVRSQLYHSERPPLFVARCRDAARCAGSSATADTSNLQLQLAVALNDCSSISVTLRFDYSCLEYKQTRHGTLNYTVFNVYTSDSDRQRQSDGFLVVLMNYFTLNEVITLILPKLTLFVHMSFCSALQWPSLSCFVSGVAYFLFAVLQFRASRVRCCTHWGSNNYVVFKSQSNAA